MNQSFRDGFEKVSFLFVNPQKYKARLAKSPSSTDPKDIARYMTDDRNISIESGREANRALEHGILDVKSMLKQRGYERGVEHPAFAGEFTFAGDFRPGKRSIPEGLADLLREFRQEGKVY
jgi:hypothetical protein